MGFVLHLSVFGFRFGLLLLFFFFFISFLPIAR